jgi:pSer/pThr/pTyr-binding forkhead associated (FHA) protein
VSLEPPQEEAEAVGRSEESTRVAGESAVLELGAVSGPVRALLRIKGGAAGDLTLTLEEGTYRIGRSEQNDFQLSDPSVSASHCEVTLDAGGSLTVRDLGSTNGTFVENRRVTEAVIRLGQTLRLGSVDLVFENPAFVPAKAAQTASVQDLSATFVVTTTTGELLVPFENDDSANFSPTFAPGVTLQDRYRLEGELGRGGMGQVFLARDVRLDRPVAIKVIALRSSKAKGASRDPALRKSFEEEARLGANLQHPAIATVFDYGFHEGRPFTVFEYIEGETLQELIQRCRRVPLDEIRLIIAPLAQALDFAHSNRIIHRDLKPENIRATAQGFFKILDLGLAKRLLENQDWSGFAGTPAYASPEQAAGLPLDGRSDQYTLALIVYEMLAGRRPFQATNPHEILRLHLQTAVPDPLSFLAPGPDAVQVGAAVLRALAKDPNDRFASCTDFAAALGCRMVNSEEPQPLVLLEASLSNPLASTLHGLLRLRIWHRWGLYRQKYAMLMSDALWCDDEGQIQRWPLREMTELKCVGRELAFWMAADGSCNRVAFSSDLQCLDWCERINRQRQAVLSKPGSDPGFGRPSPVVLLRRKPDLPLQFLGPVKTLGHHRPAREAGIRIRAAALGAHAVITTEQARASALPGPATRLSGIAIRAADPIARSELSARWFAERVSELSLKSVVLLLAAALLSPNVGWIVALGLHATQTTGDPRLFLPLWWLMLGANAQAQYFVGATAYYAWPLLIALFIWFLAWPQLMRPAAISLLGALAVPVMAYCYFIISICAPFVSPKGTPQPSSLFLLFFITLLLILLTVVIWLLGLLLATRMWCAPNGLIRAQQILEQRPLRARRWIGHSLLLISSGLAIVSMAAFSPGMRILRSQPTIPPAQMRRVLARDYDPAQFDLPDIGVSWLLTSGWREDKSHSQAGLTHVFSLENLLWASAVSLDTVSVPPYARLNLNGSLKLKQEALLYHLQQVQLLKNITPAGDLYPIEKDGVEWLEMPVKGILGTSRGTEFQALMRVHSDSKRLAYVIVYCPASEWNKLQSRVIAAADGFRLTQLPPARVLQPASGANLSTNFGNTLPYCCRLARGWLKRPIKAPWDLCLQRDGNLRLGVQVEDFSQPGQEKMFDLPGSEANLLRVLQEKPNFESLGREDIEVAGHRGRLLRVRFGQGRSQTTVLTALFAHSGWGVQVQAETTNPSPENLRLLEEAIAGIEFPRD